MKTVDGVNYYSDCSCAVCGQVKPVVAAIVDDAADLITVCFDCCGKIRNTIFQLQGENVKRKVQL